MKKLDKLIIKSFIGPFVATFFITLFVLDMQFFWLWVDDFVGKGVDGVTLIKFISYLTATLVPLALPLSLLLSSLMTFGNLGETFELVAIKSAGISLLRFMRPLFFVAILISFGAFLFSNYVIPVALLKQRIMLADVVLAKPTFLIKEGIFNDKLEGFAIKIGKKEPNDSVIQDVVVYEQNNVLQDNFIIAKSGIMKPSPDNRYLDFHLKDGIRYQERGNLSDSATEYIRLGFKEYKKQLDISSFNFKASADSTNQENEKVYSMRQLDVAIDSMNKFNIIDKKRFHDNFYMSMSVLSYKDSVLKGVALPDSIINIKKNISAYVNADKAANMVAKNVADSLKIKWKKFSASPQKKSSKLVTKKRIKDSVKAKSNAVISKKDSSIAHIKTVDTAKAHVATGDTAKKDTALSGVAKTAVEDSIAKVKKMQAFVPKPIRDSNTFMAILPDTARQMVRDRALSIITSMKANMEMNVNSIGEQDKNLSRYKIEWHRKIALALACLVLFMIGAPLGSIIRKGGLGTPLIFAIAFFMIFYFVSTRGEKLAKEGVMTPFHGMWLATYVLVPIGLFLTYKAMRDSNLLNKEFYSRVKRNLQKRFGRKEKNTEG